MSELKDDGVLRTFPTGATRDTSENKLDFEAFLSPRVLRRYAKYLHANREQSDGKLRAGDNWQQGIPKEVYMKSLMRHVLDVWGLHRQDPLSTSNMETSLCAVIFNAMGYLFEETRTEKKIACSGSEVSLDGCYLGIAQEVAEVDAEMVRVEFNLGENND